MEEARRPRRASGRSRRRALVASTAALALMLPMAGATAQEDPRSGLAAGLDDAGEASENMELVSQLDKPEGFFDEDDPGAQAYWNSDLAFVRGHAVQGVYAGFLIYDLADPANPELRTAVDCPGGQGDVSAVGDLLFVSVQQLGTRDCTPLQEGDDRFVGVRIFDISDLDSPEQVAAVETCRGSHTHTLVEDLNDDDNLYIYVNGTSGVRSDAPEGLDCAVGPLDPETGRPSNDPADFDADTDTDRFQIEVIQVPIDNAQDAEIVNEARLFADEEGNPFGLGAGEGRSRVTDACHDITAYPEIGLAAGACSGDGLLIDITDPADPQRIDDVADTENFAYWHSATFSNDGTKVVFTDELGGGGAPTCIEDVPDEWGANAIFDIVEGADGPEMQFASYYKIPPVQTETENCVAHNGSLLPVPGRDIMVQSWYQGGISVFDFTDSSNPYEIAFFDRGPIDPDELVLGGYWSAYYYNGYIYGSEIARGFDTLQLTPSEHLSADELADAAAVRLRDFNPQAQPMITDANRSAAARVEPVSFPDPIASVHRGNVGTIAGYGIAEGYADGTYGARDDVSRAQMASFIQRMLRVAGVDLPDSPPDAFTDDSGRHEQAINELAELGIIRGVTSTEYAPTDPVSRAQMASLIVRSAEYILDEDLDAPTGPFSDVGGPGSAHGSAINAAFEAGIVQGTTETTYSPTDDVSREQMGSFLARTLELLHFELVELNSIR